MSHNCTFCNRFFSYRGSKNLNESNCYYKSVHQLSAARGQQRLNRIGSTSYPSERGNDVEPNQKQLSEASVTNSDDIQIQHTEEYNCDTSTDETLLLYQNNIEDL